MWGWTKNLAVSPFPFLLWNEVEMEQKRGQNVSAAFTLPCELDLVLQGWSEQTITIFVNCFCDGSSQSKPAQWPPCQTQHLLSCPASLGQINKTHPLSSVLSHFHLPSVSSVLWPTSAFRLQLCGAKTPLECRDSGGFMPSPMYRPRRPNKPGV